MAAKIEKNKIKQIISEFAYQLGLGEQENIYQAFGQLINEYFHHNKILNTVIYNAHTLSKQDFDYLFELASLIYEKFPKQRHKALAVSSLELLTGQLKKLSSNKDLMHQTWQTLIHQGSL